MASLTMILLAALLCNYGRGKCLIIVGTEGNAQKACDAIDSLYHDGTIRLSTVVICRIQLTRSRMQDLDFLYYTTLHL